MRAAAVTIALVSVTALTVAGVSGNNRFSGPVLLTLSATHGVRAGDLVVSVLGMVVVAVVAFLARR